MILVDTSIWAQHIRREIGIFASLLEAGEVLIHPFVIGELAIGNLPQRDAFIRDLQDLPQAIVATDQETLQLIEQWRLFGIGIGYVDAHLIASARLSSAASLWTFDKKLEAAAARLDIAYRPS